ncbi:hypothetical protein GW17_00023960, partial [Ensete ventricosum]
MSEPTWPAPSCGFFTSPVDAVAHETLLPLQLRTRRKIPRFVPVLSLQGGTVDPTVLSNKE